MTTHKTDDEFFEYFCSCANTVFNNGENEVVFIKNKDLQPHYYSPEYLDKLQAGGTVSTSSEEELSEIQKYTDEIALKQDTQIKNTLKGRSYLYVDIYDRIGIIRKRPIINPDTNNFVGILGLVKPYTMPNILATIYKINGINFGLVNKTAKNPLRYELNEKQNMVLFLYVNKYSNAEISEILTILGHKMSKTRVNDHLESLKFIFHVKTKEQLIEKAIALDYHLLIPRKFLKIGSYEIDDEVIIAG